MALITINKPRNDLVVVACPKCAKERPVRKSRIKLNPLCKDCSTTSHGLSGTPEYRAWHQMKQRCLNPRASGYKEWYGGAGIKVCGRWLQFENFYSDMGKRPTPLHSLDRIDYTKDYTPENCRWADKTTQANNTSRNVIITFKGETMSLSQWSRELEVDVGTLKYWVNKRKVEYEKHDTETS